MMKETTRDVMETTAQVLLRCWGLGFALLFFTFGMFMVGGNMIEEIHGKMFDLSAHELDLIMYCGMGLLKLAVLVLFLMPWIAIKLVLRKARG